MRGSFGFVLSLLVALLITLLVPGAGHTAGEARQPPFSLAILRRDGILMPFAAYDGSGWKNPWPSPGQSADMPLSAADIPKGWWLDKHPNTDWTLLPLGRPPAGNAAASRPTTAHVTGINWFKAGCQQAVGLFTDYKPAILPPPPRMQPYPKDALASAGAVKIAPIEVVDPQDRVAFNLADQLPHEITPEENRLIESYTNHRWKHSYTEDEREKVPVSLEALYRVRQGLDGLDLYYYEAVKRYFMPKDDSIEKRALAIGKRLPKEDPTCDLITFASGWFTTETGDGRISYLASRPKVAVTSCDYNNVGFMLPLGTLTIDGKRLWIVQWSTTMDESYVVIEPRKIAHQVLIDTRGGSCQPGPEE